MRMRWLGVAAMLLATAILCCRSGAAPPRMEARAERELRRMCTFLGALPAFSVSAEESYDESEGAGPPVLVSNHRRITLRRPDRLLVVSSGDTANREFRYDGRTAMLYDRKNNVYGQEKAQGRVDAVLDQLFQKYRVVQPLADLLFPDPEKVLAERTVSGRYAGTHQVGGTACHHLAFQAVQADWQLWIDAGTNPVPRKLLIVFKKEQGAPRYTATFSEWNLHPNVNEAAFTFTPPAGARRIQFVPAGVSLTPPARARR